MASTGSIFFAGVGTTFLILGAGFGSGLFMANTAMKEGGGYQAKAGEGVPAPIRVILPSSAQAAESKPVVTKQPFAPAPQVQGPVKEAQAPPDQMEKTERKADADMRRKQTAERKAKRLAARRGQQNPEGRSASEPRILAFGADEPRQSGGFNFFDNDSR